MSFDTVLIANRGEIALRVIQACRELHLRSVCVYSEADAGMPYLRLADESVCIGPPEPARSYLNVAAIVSAAELAQAGGIHPGYGFLAETPHFVEVCEEHGIAFIGPPRSVMELLGDKLAAREAVAGAGVPILPGEPAPADSTALLEAGERVGYPLLIKAVFGGGGRGMRRVADPDELVDKAVAASEEARTACGDGALYLEKALPDPRHVEVQIVGDEEGSLVHLGERECSIQRRHQKLIEESPAPSLSEDARGRLREAALRAARAVGYRNVGTVEFLLAPDGAFYFIEMNARIQVEHSVSEAVCGVNLIKEQILLATGERLSFTQEEVEPRGHAIECRLNAEDPKRDFLPSCGKITIDQLPGGHGVRLDTAIYNGMDMLPYYDSLVAKLVTWGQDREDARLRMITALQRFELSGIETTRDLVAEILARTEFKTGEYTTAFLEGLRAG
jgi:acetyl-CoA carboxylase biotin carboxylase subunit